MAMRFRHLKKTSKEAVGVYRLVGLGGGCPLGGWTGALVWGCLGSVPLPPDFPLAPSYPADLPSMGGAYSVSETSMPARWSLSILVLSFALC